MSNCVKCGNRLVFGEAFCRECGAKRDALPPSEPAAVSGYNAPAKNRGAVVAVCVVTLLLLMTGILALLRALSVDYIEVLYAAVICVVALVIALTLRKQESGISASSSLPSSAGIIIGACVVELVVVVILSITLVNNRSTNSERVFGGEDYSYNSSDGLADNSTYGSSRQTSSPSVSTQGTFTDPRDGKTYRTVRIGNLTWMAQNLNYQTSGSFCYDNKTSYCATYGRLYTWNAAMSACPSGWWLPGDSEWDDLVSVTGGAVAGSKLKSKTGWKDNGNGTDAFGFSALPGGHRWSGRFADADYGGGWWSATEIGAGNARSRIMGYDENRVLVGWRHKDNVLSVRCVRN